MLSQWKMFMCYAVNGENGNSLGAEGVPGAFLPRMLAIWVVNFKLRNKRFNVNIFISDYQWGGGD